MCCRIKCGGRHAPSLEGDCPLNTTVVVLVSSSLARLVLVREVQLRTERLGYRAIATRLTGEAIKTKTGLSCCCRPH